MSDGSILRGKSRLMLSAGVSIAALVVALPGRAAAEPSWTRALIADRGEFRAFVQGGVFWTGGDPVPYAGGFSPFVNAIAGALGGPVFPAGTIPVIRPGLGWDVAAGADYRFAGTPWHVNMQGRYGRVTKSDNPFASSFALSVPPVPPDNEGVGGFGGLNANASAATQPILRESHWQADFGVGYDFMRGMQLNFGFRVAELRSEIDALTGLNIALTDATGATLATAGASSLVTDRRAFFGAGPRLGLEGSVPLLGGWTFDYSGNVAILFGNTKFSTGQVVGLNVNAPGNFVFAINGLGLNQVSWSAPNTVYNFDIEGGFGYWFNPNWKLVLSYRLDAFIDPLRVAPDDGATNAAIGPGRSMDRFYHGPKVALQAKFP